MNKTKNKLWAVVLYVWSHPIILAPILLILAYFLFDDIRTQAFRNIMNCDYTIGSWIGINSWGSVTWPGSGTWTNLFCNGITIATLPIPGLASILNPLLEFVRTVTVWAILLFFAFFSLLLTLIINNLKTIVRILTFDREEWKRFGANIATFLLIFVVFCTLFYFNVMHPNFLNIRMLGH